MEDGTGNGRGLGVAIFRKQWTGDQRKKTSKTDTRVGRLSMAEVTQGGFLQGLQCGGGQVRESAQEASLEPIRLGVLFFFFKKKKWGEGRGDKSQREVGVETEELKLALWWLNLEADTASESRDYKSREVAGYREGLGFPTSTPD